MFSSTSSSQAQTKNVLLDHSTRAFLAKTYGTIAFTCCTCAYGVQVSSLVRFNPTGLAVAMCLIAVAILISSSDTGSRTSLVIRLTYIAIFGFLQGLALGGVVADALAVDPNMLLAAVFTVAVVFVSFTLAVLLSNKRETVYIGSTTLAIQVCLLAQLVSGIHIDNQLVACTLLCFSCAYLAYDTEKLVVRCLNGDIDFIRGAMHLFLDGVIIFVRVLAVMRASTRGGTKSQRSMNGNGSFSRKYDVVTFARA
jgi:FtsH-binding integral membrane protein